MIFLLLLTGTQAGFSQLSPYNTMHSGDFRTWSVYGVTRAPYLYQENHDRTFRFGTFIPSIIIMSGGLLTNRETGFLNKHDIQDAIRGIMSPDFHTHADDYFQYVPIAGVITLDMAGVETTNRPLKQTILLGTSEILMGITVGSLKKITHIERPDGSNFYSFPSGHTAQAFVSAAFMSKELGQKSIWFSIGAYTIASVTGFLRIANNKHYISDVLFGAGLGILTVHSVYAVDHYLRKQ